MYESLTVEQAEVLVRNARNAGRRRITWYFLPGWDVAVEIAGVDPISGEPKEGDLIRPDGSLEARKPGRP